MRKVKKMLSIVLALSLLVSFAGVSALAEGVLPMHATEVIAYDQGSTAGGSAVGAFRSDPNAALGAFDAAAVSLENQPEYFYSLGFDGWLLLSFPEDGIPNEAGPDIIFREVTNPLQPPYPREAMRVYGAASLEGLTYPNISGWTYLGTVSNAKAADNITNIDNTLDFPASVSTIKYILMFDDCKVRDFMPAIPGADGYDLDAVEAYYAEPEQLGDVSVYKRNIYGSLITGESFKFNLYATDVDGNKTGDILYTEYTNAFGVATFSDLELHKTYFIEEELSADQLARFYLPPAGISVVPGDGVATGVYNFVNEYRYVRTEVTKYVGFDSEGYGSLTGTRFESGQWAEYASIAAAGSGSIDIIAGNTLNESTVIGSLNYTYDGALLTASYTLKAGVAAVGAVDVPVYLGGINGTLAGTLSLTAPGVAKSLAVSGALALDLNLNLKNAWIIDSTTPAGPFYFKLTGPSAPAGAIIRFVPGVTKTFQLMVGDYTLVECDAQGNPIANPQYRLVAEPGTQFSVYRICQTTVIKLLNVPITR